MNHKVFILWKKQSCTRESQRVVQVNDKSFDIKDEIVKMTKIANNYDLTYQI